MTNKLDEAKELLANGWCTKNLERDGKYCSVGALVHVLGINMEWKPYTDVDETPEARALAEVIMDTYYDDYKYIAAEYMEARRYGEESPSDVIVPFNDDQKSVEPVLQMFEKASAKLEEQV